MCMRAEDLMQKSAGQEKFGDLASALVHCQKAMGKKKNSLSEISERSV